MGASAMAWAGFAAAFAAFFASHSLPLRPGVRARLTARLGRRGFSWAYSALSLGALAWLIAAAGGAPVVVLWPWAPWRNHLALALTLAACLVLALALGRPNPFSFGGARAGAFDPARPGLLRWTRHPLLAALALWAWAHLLANGTLAHAILFGAFAGFAGLGMRMIDRRRRHEPGWAEAVARLRASPLLPRPASIPAAAARLAAGVLLWAALIALHPWVIGVSPLP